ncbi:hypothetical protein ACFCYA_15860, partial [Streptomyces virginiae]
MAAAREEDLDGDRDRGRRRRDSSRSRSRSRGRSRDRDRGRARDRLDPAAVPYVDALAAAFPDLGRGVTGADEARRILAAASR